MSLQKKKLLQSQLSLYVRKHPEAMPFTAMWKFFIILFITLKSTESRVIALDGFDYEHAMAPVPATQFTVIDHINSGSQAPQSNRPSYTPYAEFHYPDPYSTKKEITDCYFIGNGTQSMGIVCGNDSVEKYSKSENCFALLVEGNLTKIKSLNLKSLKLQKNCELKAPFIVTFLRPNEQKLYILENSRSTSIINSALTLSNALNLTEIDYSFNKIDRITAHDFDNLKYLTTITLTNNSIRYLDVNAFLNLKELKYLDLSNNSIGIIENDLFKNNKHLEWLRLENNPIIRLDSGIFSLFKNVAAVNISLDKVNEIEISYGTMLKNKLKFQISDETGLIIDLIDGASKFHYTKENLTNLVSFNISGHQLNNTKELLKLLGPSIKYLDISSNFIGAIDGETFKNFKKLEILNLAQTNLSNFGFTTMYNQNQLLELNLSYNQLKKVNFTILAWNLRTLFKLNLEGNDLVEVDTVNGHNFPNLRYLALSKNIFSCDYLITYFQQWPRTVYTISNPSDGTHIKGIDCIHSDDLTIEETSSTPTNYLMIEIRIFEALLVIFCIYFVIKKNPIQCLKRRIWLGSNITYRRDEIDSHDFNISIDQNSFNGISFK